MTKSTYQETEEAAGKLQRAKLSSASADLLRGLQGLAHVREHFETKHAGASVSSSSRGALKEGEVPLPVLISCCTRRTIS